MATASKGHIVAVPEGSAPPMGATDIPKGIKVSASALIKATSKARKTGKPVLVRLGKQVKQKQPNPDDEGATTVWRTADTVAKKVAAAGARQQSLKQMSGRGREEAGDGEDDDDKANSLTLNPAAKEKEEGMARHRKLVAVHQPGGSRAAGDFVTGDGAKPQHQPVDEVSKLVAMLPYAFVAVAVAVVFVICLLGKVMKMKAEDNSSYFGKDGMQDGTRSVPKMKGGFGRRY